MENRSQNSERPNPNYGEEDNNSIRRGRRMYDEDEDIVDDFSDNVESNWDDAEDDSSVRPKRQNSQSGYDYDDDNEY